MDDKTINVVPEQIESLAIRQGTAMAVDRAPDEVLAEAQKAAKALRDVVSQKKKKVMFNGEQYLEFEDLQTLGHFYGVTAGEDGDPEPVVIGEVTGFKASSVAYRHGQVISRATQYCMSDEPNWARKPLFQLSSMAQTRANAKVLRNVLAWVVVLAGYRPTPAEEMDNLARPEPQTSKPKEAASQAFPATVGEVIGTIEKLAAKKNSKGKDFMVFTLNGNSVYVWDSKLFPFIGANEGKQIAAVCETKNGYSNVIAARSAETVTVPPQDDEPPLFDDVVVSHA